MRKSALLIATLGLMVLVTGCGPEELVNPDGTTDPCGGTPEACGEPGGNTQRLTTEPCAGTPEACAELERNKQQQLGTEPCAGTPEACAELQSR